jgi:hypothetical protein
VQSGIGLPANMRFFDSSGTVVAEAIRTAGGSTVRCGHDSTVTYFMPDGCVLPKHHCGTVREGVCGE